MPGSHQRHLQKVSHPQAHDPHVARTGNLHEIRLEGSDGLKHQILIPAEQRVAEEIVIQAERRKAAFQFEPGQKLVVCQLGTRAAVRAKKGHLSAGGMRDEFAADCRHTISFSVRVGEERDAQWGCQRAASESRMETKYSLIKMYFKGGLRFQE